MKRLITFGMALQKTSTAKSGRKVNHSGQLGVPNWQLWLTFLKVAPHDVAKMQEPPSIFSYNHLSKKKISLPNYSADL